MLLCIRQRIQQQRAHRYQRRLDRKQLVNTIRRFSNQTSSKGYGIYGQLPSSLHIPWGTCSPCFARRHRSMKNHVEHFNFCRCMWTPFVFLTAGQRTFLTPLNCFSTVDSLQTWLLLTPKYRKKTVHRMGFFLVIQKKL